MHLFLLMIVAAAAGPPAGAALRPVMIDWSAVSDATVQRCGLGLLQSLLLQGMVESGFAVVDTAGPQVIKVTLRERKGAVLVEAQRDDVVARRRVAVPVRCDSTIGVDLQAAARGTALEVEQVVKERQPPPPANSEPVTPPPTSPLWAEPTPSRAEPLRAEVVAPEIHERGPARIRGRLGAGVALSHADSPFVAVTAQLGGRFGGWSVAASFDGALRNSLGVTVFEPALGPEVSRIVRLGGMELGVGAAVQLLGHAFWRDDDRGGHLDVRFSVPVRLEHAGTGIGLALVPNLRLRPVEHRVGEDVAYSIGHFGGLAALTFRVPP